MNSEHTFSWGAIFRILITILAIYFVWKTLSVILSILIALMLATALYPIVKRLSRRFPSVVSTLFIVILLFVPFIVLIVTITPVFFKQVPELVTTFAHLFQSSPFIPESLKRADFTQYVQSGASYVLRSTNFVTGAITSVITVIFLIFYLIIDADKLVELFLSLFPVKERRKIATLASEVAQINGQYIRGNLLISVICSLVIFIGLTILRLPFAAPLAIFAGLFDLLPLIGSTIAMIPAIIIGFTISPLTGILVLVLFLLYQQAENSIIAPTIYRRALDISPALSFIAVIIGSALFGILGAFIALPLAASVPSVIKYFREDGYKAKKPKQKTVKNKKRS